MSGLRGLGFIATPAVCTRPGLESLIAASVSPTVCTRFKRPGLESLIAASVLVRQCVPGSRGLG